MTLLPQRPARPSSAGRVDLVKHQPAELEPAVLDAEVVAAPTVPRRPVGRRVIHAVGVIREKQPVRRVVHSKPVARTGRALKAAPRVTTRAGYVTTQGGISWTHRAWAAATHGTYRAQIRIAEATGDRETLDRWVEQLDKAKTARMHRVLALPKMVLAAVVACGIGIAVGLLIALAVGVIVSLTPAGLDWDGWWGLLAATLDVIGTAIKTLVAVAALGSPLILLVLLHQEGKRVAVPPRWLVTDDEKAELDSLIDERMISLALAHLGIAALAAFFKEGGHLVYTVVPRTDGEGTYAQVRLPLGVTAEMVAEPKPRAKLAANLNRASLETWPTKGDEDGILDLWVADKGKLNAGAGPWPLIDDGTVDAFEGVPFGRSQRGDSLAAPLFETNYLIGGRPGQGKSSAMRCLLLGAALDPTVEMWAFNLGESTDFDPFLPRLSRYAKGLDESVFEQAIQALRDLLAELERRGKVLAKQPGTPPKTSRKLADKPSLGLHLLVAAFDEVHELFMHPDYGKEAAGLAVRLARRGRKYGIVLIFATQAPTAESIPRDVTRNIGCGVAFSVQDHVANDGLLGTGKYKQGIRATELRRGIDRGTCVTVGITDNTFELIRTYYVPFSDGVDEVTPVIARAMAGMAQPRSTGELVAEIEPARVDPLLDIWEVLREPREELRNVLPRLRERNPETYTAWNQTRLTEYLTGEDVPVGFLKGYKVVLSADVEERLNTRLVDLGGDDE